MSRSRRRRRRMALAALALWTFALPAPPASAIPVPRLNGAGIVDLSVAARAGAALPEGPSVTAARGALEGAGTQTRSRFDEIARAGTEDAAERSLLKDCLSGARDNAVEA